MFNNFLSCLKIIYADHFHPQVCYVKLFPANGYHHNWHPIHQSFLLRVTMEPVGHSGLSFLKFFAVTSHPFCGAHWYSLFWTSVDSAHGFQNQGGSIIAHTLLSLVHNNPQSQL